MYEVAPIFSGVSERCFGGELHFHVVGFARFCCIRIIRVRRHGLFPEGRGLLRIQRSRTLSR
jgi:hypothetical protein